jgi:hypothetical protein
MARVILSCFSIVALCGCGGISAETGSESESESESESGSSETGDEECPELIAWGDVGVYSADAAFALPKYTQIRGHLQIEGVDGITDLRFLECLQVAYGIGIVNNDDLKSLAGLERLTLIPSESEGGSATGGLDIWRNDKLLSLEGLSSLVATPDLSVEDNQSLLSLEGLSSLREVSVWLSVLRNYSLQTVGLRQLETTDYIQIGYAMCTGVGPPAGSEGNGLVEFDGFDSLVDFGYMRISETALTSLDGLVANLEGSSGLIKFELNTSLPYTEIVAAADALARSVDVISCGGLDDPTPCECAGSD